MDTDYHAVEGQLLRQLTDGAIQPQPQLRPAGPPPAIPDHLLLRRIGVGSYGDVWLARNVVGTYRAVKIVYRGRFGSARPFEREFHGIQRYEPVSRRHEGLVDILQIGRNDEAGFFYYVMELADDAAAGPPLAAPSDQIRQAISHATQLASRDGDARLSTTEHLSAAPPAPGPEIVPENYRPRTLASEIRRAGRLSPADCVHVFLSLAAALSTLHRAGLLHRDIKPSNIILVGGMAKLADIGLVAEAGTQMTFVGTEGFIPPEGPGTPGADLYALGKMFYEAFTGLDRLQFPSLPVGPENIAELQPLLELSAVANRACSADPTRRYDTADDLLADLAVLHSGRSVQRMRLVEVRLHKARRFGLVAAGIAVVGIAVGIFLQSQRTRDRRHRDALAAALADARVHRAHAERIAGQPGARFAVLDAVKEAARTHPDIADLRTSAISALAQPDVRERARIPSPDPEQRSFVWNDSGTLLATPLADGAIRISREPDGEPLRTLRAGGLLVPMSMDDAGKWLVARRGEQSFVLLDLQTDAVRWESGAEVIGVILDPHRPRLLLVRSRGPCQIFDIDSNTLRDLKVAVSPSDELAASNIAAGRVILANRYERDISLVDIEATSLLATWTLPEGARIFGLSLSHDGRWIRVGSADFRVFVFDAREPARPPIIATDHRGAVISGDFQTAPETFFSTGWDHSTRLFETATGRQITVLPSWSYGLGFVDQGRRFFRIDGVTRALHVYDFANSACRTRSEPAAPRGTLSPGAPCFSPDGALLALPSWQGVRLLRASDGEFLGLLTGAGAARSVAFEGDGSLLASGATEMKRWKIQREGTAVRIAPPEPFARGFAWMLATSRTGSMVVLAGANGVFRSLDAAKPEKLEEPLAAPDLAFRLVATSPDGRWIAASQTRLLRVWNGANRAVQWNRNVEWESIPIFSPDSRFLTVNDRHHVSVLEIETQKVVWQTPQPEGAGLHGAWSPDGRWLVVARRPDSLTAFDAATGTVWGQIRHPDARVIGGVTFSPDGRQLVAGTTSGVVHLWQLAELREGLRDVGIDFPLPPEPPPGTGGEVRIELPTAR